MMMIATKKVKKKKMSLHNIKVKDIDYGYEVLLLSIISITLASTKVSFGLMANQHLLLKA